MALDLGGGGVHAQELGGQGVFLAGRVFERQGFRGFVQFDVGGELGHDRMSVGMRDLTLVAAGLLAMAILCASSPASRAPARNHITYRI
ncbi:hypothetical protein D3C72_2258200 [compost metagenome]